MTIGIVGVVIDKLKTDLVLCRECKRIMCNLKVKDLWAAACVPSVQIFVINVSTGGQSL